MITTIKLTINHKEKLPDGLTDVVADRAYQYIHAKGVNLGPFGDVTAEILDLIALPVVDVKDLHDRVFKEVAK